VAQPVQRGEPSFRIILKLPKTPGQLAETLSPLYRRATVYRRIKMLKELGAVREEGGALRQNL